MQGATTSGLRGASYVTVAFSGAGHLLAYHLGVASVLQKSCDKGKENRSIPPIRAASGSSSGAIAAAVLAFMPHRLHDYTDRLLKERGRAFSSFQELLKEELEAKQDKRFDRDLFVCVTKSEDGKSHLIHHPSSASLDVERVLRSVEASCRIPVSFHPLDLFKSSASYEEEGIEVDGTLYVDGGVSGVFPPPCPLDQDSSASSHRILVCPISIGPTAASELVISPSYSRESPLIFSMMPKTRDGTMIQPTVQNLQNLVAAAGFTSPEVLYDWHRRGAEDAALFIEIYLDSE
jgi:predicted acylesterase/phospholipase RssA